ncbi:MAG: RSP_2648 family PIN domain-containing protein [Pararhodobacter sp.]
MTARVFLDTCVLFPPILRNLLLTLADAGMFTPLWSEGVEAEWLHVTARKGEAGAVEALGRMRARWPEGLTAAGEPEWLELPDSTDRHVLASAIAGGAGVLLTLNRRDFPRRALEPHGLAAVTPDDFVMDLWLGNAVAVEAGVAQVWPGVSGAVLRKALKKADLPRLGRALEAA